MARGIILALDQGTTSTRAIAYRPPELAPLATARRDLPQHFPASGWVVHMRTAIQTKKTIAKVIGAT